jgi:hypothetical protein
MKRVTDLPRSFVSSACLLLALAGCGGSEGKDGKGGPPGRNFAFESDLPGDGIPPETVGGKNPNPHGNEGPGNPGLRGAFDRDIVQAVGDRLYTLSLTSGLSIIDLATPSALPLLGRLRDLPGTPFDLRIRNDVALATFHRPGRNDREGASFVWTQASRVLAVDVQNPKSLAALSSIDVDGVIVATQLAGDVLYVASHRASDFVLITSIDVSNPAALRKLDELRIAGLEHAYPPYDGVIITAGRIYVASPRSSFEGTGATIHVLDISGQGGELAMLGAVPVVGNVTGATQMSEHEGVLRVAAQRFTHEWNEPLVVQTFDVTSSKSPVELGRLEHELPKVDGSVRATGVQFDGPRAYASNNADKLSILDLTNPELPSAAATLDVPTQLYRLEARGDRLLVLGDFFTSDEGSTEVSLFDVSDAKAPVKLDSVRFGEGAQALPSDDDRMHHEFRISPEIGLMTVPVQSFFVGDESCEALGHRTAVRLIDFDGDTLATRGVVPSTIETRRALVHDGRLLTFGDEALSAHDIADRTQPKQDAALFLSRDVQDTLSLENGTAVRFARRSAATRAIELEFTREQDVEVASASSVRIEPRELLGYEACWRSNDLTIEAAHARGNRVEIAYMIDSEVRRAGVAVIDVSDPAKPKLAGKLDWPHDGWVESSVQTSDGIALRFAANAGPAMLRLIDLRDPTAIAKVDLTLGDNVWYGDLQVSDKLVLTSHYEPGSDGRVHYFVDRFDVSDPAAPVRLDSINVPGSLAHYDGKTARVVTQEQRRTVIEHVTLEACRTRFGDFRFHYDEELASDELEPTDPGRCEGFVSRLNLLKLGEQGAELIDSLELEEAVRITSLAGGAGRLLATLARAESFPDSDCLFSCSVYEMETPRLLAVSGLADQALSASTLSLERPGEPWHTGGGLPWVRLHGEHALVTSGAQAVVVDVSDIAAPTMVRHVDLRGALESVRMTDDAALFSLGNAGVQRLTLGD